MTITLTPAEQELLTRLLRQYWYSLSHFTAEESYLDQRVGEQTKLTESLIDKLGETIS